MFLPRIHSIVLSVFGIAFFYLQCIAWFALAKRSFFSWIKCNSRDKANEVKENREPKTAAARKTETKKSPVQQSAQIEQGERKETHTIRERNEESEREKREGKRKWYADEETLSQGSKNNQSKPRKFMFSPFVHSVSDYLAEECEWEVRWWLVETQRQICDRFYRHGWTWGWPSRCRWCLAACFMFSRSCITRLSLCDALSSETEISVCMLASVIVNQSSHWSTRQLINQKQSSNQVLNQWIIVCVAFFPRIWVCWSWHAAHEDDADHENEEPHYTEHTHTERRGKEREWRPVALLPTPLVFSCCSSSSFSCFPLQKSMAR